MKKRNIICPEQIGFCKGKRTSDHIFVIKTLIDKFTQKDSRPNIGFKIISYTTFFVHVHVSASTLTDSSVWLYICFIIL
jgi:hypothetical protein